MAVAAVVLGIGLGSSPASALVLPGNGPDESDCYVGLDIGSATGAVIDDTSKKKVTVTCTDGDPCDLDGACNGTCEYNVGACINLAGQTGCTPPGTLDKVTAKGKVKGVKGDAGKVVIEVPQLLEGSVCGAFIDVNIPIKTTKKGDKPNKAGVKLSATAPKGTKPRKDKDKFELICNPCAGSASGAFLD
jgi:hypothetical protein